MYIIDTNVLSEMRRQNRANKNVIAWSDSTQPSDTFLSAITILEIEQGILAIERKDILQGRILRRWINNIVPKFEDRILPVDTEIARCCARLHIPDPRSERDALIAATALIHNMTIVTRNTADFAPMISNILNPWDL